MQALPFLKFQNGNPLTSQGRRKHQQKVENKILKSEDEEKPGTLFSSPHHALMQSCFLMECDFH